MKSRKATPSQIRKRRIQFVLVDYCLSFSRTRSR